MLWTNLFGLTNLVADRRLGCAVAAPRAGR
jgi:hypothetical protein